MGTVPTGRMERELRALYLRWLAGLPTDGDMTDHVNTFQRTSTALIQRLGGQVASLGALAGFPTPKLLELSPHVGTVYDQMKQAAIQASIQAGISSKEAARAMFNAGMDKSYRRLERLARTETTSAYWKNGWDSVADLPAIVMVWGSESGPRTCQYCMSRDGLVVEDRKIRDHPNGRCTLIPTLRSKVKYKGTLQPDGSVTMDPRWAGQHAPGAKAQASAGPTTAEQRDPLSSKANPAAPSQAQPAQASQGSATAQATPVPVQGPESYRPYTYRELPNDKTLLNSGIIDVDEFDALQFYKRDGYAQLNETLRAGGSTAESKLIDKVMQKSQMPSAGVTHRGQGLEEFVREMGIGPDKQWLSDQFAQSGRPEEFRELFYELNAGKAPLDFGTAVGKSFVSDSYVSTSVRDHLYDAPAFADKPLQFEIYVPEGTRGLTLGAGSERELLLDRGLNFTVVGTEVLPDGKTLVKLLVSGGLP